MAVEVSPLGNAGPSESTTFIKGIPEGSLSRSAMIQQENGHLCTKKWAFIRH